MASFPEVKETYEPHIKQSSKKHDTYEYVHKHCFICNNDIFQIHKDDNLSRIIDPNNHGYLVSDTTLSFAKNDKYKDKHICISCLKRCLIIDNNETKSFKYINELYNNSIKIDNASEISDDKSNKTTTVSGKSNKNEHYQDTSTEFMNHEFKDFNKFIKNTKDAIKNLDSTTKKITNNENIPFLNLIPAQIKEKLDEYVVGQDEAKKVLSVAIYNHIKRIKLSQENENVKIDKSNILLMGPTGSGKTYLIKSVAKILNVPFISIPLTKFSATGWVGGNLDTIIASLFENNDNKYPEYSIVYFDETDKMMAPQISANGTNHAQLLQNELLTLLEGALQTNNNDNKNVNISSDSLSNKIKIYDTSNMLFILGGSFAELEHRLKEKNKSSNIGFNSTKKEINTNYQYLKKVTNEDLIEFGMIPELAGRLPIKCVVDKLDNEMYKKILIEPKDSIIQQYKDLLSVDNVELVVEDSALEAIAYKADALGIGARGLRSVLEDIMITAMYEIPNDKTITKVILNDKVINHESDIIYVRDKKE